MSKIIATLIASIFTATAFAQMPESSNVDTQAVQTAATPSSHTADSAKGHTTKHSIRKVKHHKKAKKHHKKAKKHHKKMIATTSEATQTTAPMITPATN